MKTTFRTLFALLCAAFAMSGCARNAPPPASPGVSPGKPTILSANAVSSAAEEDDVDELIPVIERDASEVRGAALHEAGHAIVRIYLMGVERVAYIKVFPKKTVDGMGGRTVSTQNRTFLTADDIRRDASDSMGGRAADALLGRGADTGATGDIQYVTKAFTRMILQNGLSDSLVYRETLTEADEVDLKYEVQNAYTCATGIVSANSVQVNALADYILSRPLKDGAHLLRHEDLIEFLNKVPLADAVSVDSDVRLPDFCVRVAEE